MPRHLTPRVGERAPLLTARRDLKMARSAHAYVRGSTREFYAWLDASGGALPAGPSVWICGDCHLGNLGPLADARGRVAVQIRDLDQTVVGNPAHDLLRLALSLATAARGSDLPGVTTAHMVEEMVQGYARALSGPAGRAEPMPAVVGAVVRRSFGRQWKHLARERIADVEPTIPLGKRFWALSEEERREIGRLFEGETVRAFIARLHPEHASGRAELLDAAYWVKGCSSLGRLRFAVLLGLGRGAAERICLMDIKEAVRAAAPCAPGTAMPGDDAERVVAGARALAPNLGGRMLAAHLLGRPVVVRELMPQDLKLEFDRLTRGQAVAAARFLAGVVGRAHARQMDRATRDAWRRELGRDRRTGGVDAPGWLWSGVVALMAAHEAAYLEHCRVHALGRRALAA